MVLYQVLSSLPENVIKTFFSYMKTSLVSLILLEIASILKLGFSKPPVLSQKSFRKQLEALQNGFLKAAENCMTGAC
jgi:hypothetical protein